MAQGLGVGDRGAGKVRARDRAPGPRTPRPSPHRAGLGCPSHTPPPAQHHCPCVPSKEDHRLVLGFRIVLEFGLFIPKKIIKSHVQKWGEGEEGRERRELEATRAGSRESCGGAVVG